MLPLPNEEAADHAALLSRILKAIRRRRGLRVIDVANRMGLPKRTYESFEDGTGKFSLARLQRFAEATDSDAYAILVSLAFGDPAFALRCADHKLMTATIMSIQDLNREAADHLTTLDARLVMHIMDRACDILGKEARARGSPRPARPR